MINSRKMNDLHPVVMGLCVRHISACKERGIQVTVTSTLRDDEYQATLYAQGRTTPGNIVTNMSVTGAHGLGLAYDLVPVVKGVAVWNDANLWRVIGEEGKKLGLAWGGDWKSFSDKPHFEKTDGLSGKELRAGKRPKWFENEYVTILRTHLDSPEQWIKAIEYIAVNPVAGHPITKYIKDMVTKIGGSNGPR